MYEYSVKETIVAHMDGLFDDERGMHWSAYVDSADRVQITVQNAETDETSHFLLTVKRN